jgi:hypothetical protein
MSLGFGQVDPKEWAGLSAGMGGDKVPVGDYAIRLSGLRVLDPTERTKGCYVAFVQGVTTEHNAEEAYRDKTLQESLRYHPNPPTDDLRTMNAITQGTIGDICKAANAAPQIDPNTQQIDLLGTLQLAVNAGALVMVTVTHSEKGYQNLGNWRPLEGA